MSSTLSACRPDTMPTNTAQKMIYSPFYTTNKHSENSPKLYCWSASRRRLSLGKGRMGSLRSCDLCGKDAVLHCDADSAYLCLGCDAKVHGANFLVARHARIILCCRCHEYTATSTCVPCPNVDKCLCSECSISDCSDKNLLRISTAESGISGRRSSSPHKTTKDGVNASDFKMCSCADDKENPRLLEVSGNPVSEVSIDKWSWSNSEDATNSLDNQPKTQQKKPTNTRYSAAVPNSDMKVQAILRRWYRYLDLRSLSTLPLAMHLVEKGLNKLGGLFRQKWRIFLAASIWLASTHCENQAHLPSIKKVEECTGVPSELIVKVESRMALILDWKVHDEEGWAESSS